jgi:hypothetical protein
MAIQERYRATSWTGSEDLRREQGVCLSPARPPVVMPRFLIRAGTACQVSKLTPLKWRPYITTRDVGLERFEFYDPKSKVYEFRHLGWLLRVHRRHVAHREDNY